LIPGGGGVFIFLIILIVVWVIYIIVGIFLNKRKGLILYFLYLLSLGHFKDILL